MFYCTLRYANLLKKTFEEKKNVKKRERERDKKKKLMLTKDSRHDTFSLSLSS